MTDPEKPKVSILEPGNRGSTFAKPRYQGCCTSCGKDLPENLLGWGLNWYDGSGMCAKCLYEIRNAVGYFSEKEIRKRKERKNQTRHVKPGRNV